MAAKPLTDMERDVLVPNKIFPHPDGKAWTKCCIGPRDGEFCRCFVRKPKGRKSRLDEHIEGDSHASWTDIALKLIAAKGRFFCVHRKDDGYHRECAGWFAKFGKGRV